MSSRFKTYFPATILFTFFLLLYVFTAAPGVYDGDSGEIAAAVNTLGLAHPTGFPLYMILGKVFTLLLPVGDIAYRLNILSALLTAGTLVFFYFTLRNLGRSSPASLAASFVLGLGRNTIWANSGRIGVYALSLFFISILFFIFSKWKQKPDTRYLYMYGFLWGLSMGTHALMIIMGIPFLFMLWQARVFLKSHIPVLIKTAIITILPGVQYVYLVFAYRRSGIINWGDMSGLDGFFYYVTQRQYAGKFLVNNFSSFLSKASNLLTSEFTVIFFVVAMIGFFVLYKKNHTFLNLLLLTMIINIVAMLIYGKNQDDLKILFRYLFIADFVLAIAVAYGLDRITGWMHAVKNRKQIIAVIAIIFLVVQFQYSYAHNNRRNNFLIEDTAHNILKTLEPNSLVLALGDHVVGPLWYLQSVGERKDVAIISTALLSYDWYVNNVTKMYPDAIDQNLLVTQKGNDRILMLIRKNYPKRPVYSVLFNSLGDNQEFDFVPQGIMFRVVPKGLSDQKKLLTDNRDIWGKYALPNVWTDSYPDQMLNDLTVSYAFSLYVAGVEYFKNGFTDYSIDFLRKSLNVYPTTNTKESFDFVRALR